VEHEGEGIVPGEARFGITRPEDVTTGAAPLPSTGWPTPVPWTAAEVVFLLLLGQLCTSLAFELFTVTGTYRHLYGPDLVRLARSTEPAGELARYRLLLWAGPAAFVIQFPVALGLLRALGGARPCDLGLTTRRLGTNLLAGLAAAAPFTVAVYALNRLLISLSEPGKEHPYTQLIQSGALSGAELGLLVLQAVVLAPVWEELLFRGVLQPYFATRRWGAHAAMTAAVALGLLSSAGPVREAVAAGPLAVLKASAPALTALALVPVYLLVWWRSRSLVGPALFATAVLFGWFHAGVWPTPVPLTLLGLGLGYLAYRTQSLVGPIVVHALFNATSCAILLVG
jgi:membrane protease YdiL (CAAX protease family)